jgi:S1-C subfamily serine protease
MKQIFYIFLLLIGLTFRVHCQSIHFNGNALGFIVLDDSIFNGTGFIIIKSNYILTCAHVIDISRKISFVSLQQDKRYELNLVRIDTVNDLALLNSKSEICNEPFVPCDTFNVQPGQHLFYIGYDIASSNSQMKAMKANNAYIQAVGKYFSSNKLVDFLEFVGVGKPGYSGGPVFNDQGQIVGIMREAWYKKGIKGGNSELINRAISIIPILQ